MSYRFPHQAYEGLPKQERRDIASHEPMLPKKRFLLSSSPEAKERLASLRRHVNDLMEIYPEFVGVGVFGSLLKGYASDESDVDAVLFIDRRRVPFKEMVRRHLQKDWVFPEDLAIDLKARLQADGYASDADLVEVTAEMTRFPDTGGRMLDCALLFLPCIGKGVQPYRKAMIKKLLSLGASGERAWRDIMEYLWFYENVHLGQDVRQERRDLYRFSLREAAGYYLGDER